MQYAYLAGKVFAAAAVYLQRAAVYFNSARKAVVVVGSDQCAGTAFNKSTVSNPANDETMTIKKTKKVLPSS